MVPFKSLGLNQWICDQLKELNVKTPTPVQENCIPEVLAGRDVLGCSKTGTGKTIAFAAPILQKVRLLTVLLIIYSYYHNVTMHFSWPLIRTEFSRWSLRRHESLLSKLRTSFLS